MGCTSPQEPIHAKWDCCSMSRPPPKTSETLWRSRRAYCRIVNEAVRTEAHSISGRHVVETKFAGLPRHFAWQNTEFLIAAMIKGLREMAGPRLSADESRHSLWRATRSCGSSNASSAALSSSARQRISSAFRMRRLLSRWSREISTCWTHSNPFARRRRRSATRLTERCGLQSRTKCRSCCRMAGPTGREWRRRWGLSERTLAQKLAEEETSYDKVVDRLRHSLALQYIKEPSLSLAHIAWLLGYEGPTSFNHAFARWTGRSASEARKKSA